MKVKFSLLAIVIAGFMVATSCGSNLGKSGVVTAANSPAYMTGQSFGGSLLGLYSQYKQTGKIDFNNANTLLQVMQLATSCNAVKSNLKNTNFYGSFVQGAILGSQQRITQSNAGGIISALTGLNFGNVAQAATGGGAINPNTATAVASTLTSVFNAFGK